MHIHVYIHSLNKLCNILNQLTIFPPRGIIGAFVCLFFNKCKWYVEIILFTWLLSKRSVLTV